MKRRLCFQPKRSRLLLLLTSTLVVALSVASVGKAAESAEFVRIKVKEANIRSGPGTSYERLWTAPRNYPYLVIGRKGRWLRVKDFEGFTEWIYAPLTDQKPAVIVKAEKANVRKGPGLKYPVKYSAERGVLLRVLTRREKWVKVRHLDGDEGWIFVNLVWGGSPEGKDR